MAISKESEITLKIGLDENKLPEEIHWQASDSGMENPGPAKAFLLSIWDPKEKSSLRIDLWTKDMTVDDMKQFFYETLYTMADTYQRACQDEEGAGFLKEASRQFAEKAELIKK